MKNILFLLISVLTILGCKSNTTQSNNTISVSRQQTDVKPSYKNRLPGVWMLKNSDTGNANFLLTDSTIYYPETDATYPYKLIGDTLEIEYEDQYIQHPAFKFIGNDTLTLTGEDGPNTFVRVKK